MSMKALQDQGRSGVRAPCVRADGEATDAAERSLDANAQASAEELRTRILTRHSMSRVGSIPFMTTGPLSPMSFAGTPLFSNAFNTVDTFLTVNQLRES